MYAVGNQQFITIVLLGLCIHVLLLIAVFDTYFKSPLEHGMTHVKSTQYPAAKRLVLIVADGFRAHSLFEDNIEQAPFLTSLRKFRSSWGVSHTRVPTESRPGHVAMLAGIFEDPSAIFKGWQHNPVNFDSVINQSTNAWCFGSPDIVPIFNKDGRPHIHTYSYDSQMQDFGNKKTTILDEWVFDKAKFILNSSKGSKELKEFGNVFFLHLLGLDTAGHAFKPGSVEYLYNIGFVDKIVQDVEKLFNSVFDDDGLTSFVFTSDHGMTNWGSHGSGLDHETYTPIIVWGAGVKIENARQDMKQIDIAPLISSLVGLNYPTNSLGKLPINYLDLSERNKLNYFLTNLQQVFKIFHAKQQKIEKSTLYYKPYKYLTADNFDRNFTELWHSNESYSVVLIKCETLFNEILRAIDYCHNYFMNYILFSVSVGLFFWILYLSTFLAVKQFGSSRLHDGRFMFTRAVLMVFTILIFVMCKIQSFQFLYYVYFLFPGFMFYIFLLKFERFDRTRFYGFTFDYFKGMYFIFFVSCIILFIYGFEYRFCFSLMMILFAFSIFLNPESSDKIWEPFKYSWIFACLVLSVFPLLPLMFTKFQLSFFIVGYLSWLCFIRFVSKEKNYNSLFNLGLTRRQKKIFTIQKIIFSISFINSLAIALEWVGDNSILKYISWVLFLFPLMLIPFSMKSLQSRIFTIMLSLGPFYLMTTMSYELIFLTFYSALLMLWMLIEMNLKTSYRNFDSVRKCFTFVAFILIGFFGTGNIASLNSFDPMWVRSLLTVFSPFKMTILIFLKLVIPFLFTACVFRYIVFKTGMNLRNSFCIILLISDIMVFYFMYHIKNVGSWLEIGMSLSHFIVVECFTIGILVLYLVAYVLTEVYITNTFLAEYGLMKIF